AVVKMQVRVDDDVDAGEFERLLAQRDEAASMSATSGRSSVMAVSTSTRASGWSMTWTQTGQRSPSTSNSATSSGVIVGGGGTRPSCHRPRTAYPADCCALASFRNAGARQRERNEQRSHRADG